MNGAAAAFSARAAAAADRRLRKDVAVPKQCGDEAAELGRTAKILGGAAKTSGIPAIPYFLAAELVRNAARTAKRGVPSYGEGGAEGVFGAPTDEIDALELVRGANPNVFAVPPDEIAVLPYFPPLQLGEEGVSSDRGEGASSLGEPRA